MSEKRYRPLEKSSKSLALEGCPNIIEAWALLFDEQEQKPLLQIKLTNLSNKRVIACKISIQYQSDGQVNIIDHLYEDISVPQGDSYGSKSPIILKSGEIREIIPSITELRFADGSIWAHPEAVWKPIDEPEPVLQDHPELKEQYALEVGGNCQFTPSIQNGLFRCTCGALNLKGEPCRLCGRTFEALWAPLSDLEQLASQKTSREETAKKNKKKRTSKILLILLFICLIAGGLVYLIPNVILPEVSYKKGISLIKDQNYEEAKAIFEDLRTYRDSQDQLNKIDEYLRLQAIKNDPYQYFKDYTKDHGTYVNTPYYKGYALGVERLYWTIYCGIDEQNRCFIVFDWDKPPKGEELTPTYAEIYFNNKKGSVNILMDVNEDGNLFHAISSFDVPSYADGSYQFKVENAYWDNMPNMNLSSYSSQFEGLYEGYMHEGLSELSEFLKEAGMSLRDLGFSFDEIIGETNQ